MYAYKKINLLAINVPLVAIQWSISSGLISTKELVDERIQSLKALKTPKTAL